MSPPDPGGAVARRTAAVWVTGTGAFLLLAAAAVFLAVRWDTLPDAAKLAVVAALTGSFLAGGRALKPTLPATGDVIFHLGAFLVPLDLAGLNLRLGLGWRELLLAEGVLCAGAFTVLAAGSGSVVLARAAEASGVVLAAGIAAVTPIPAPLLLALAAAGVSVAAPLAAGATPVSTERVARIWAATAGLAPVLGATALGVIQIVRPGAGASVLGDLGLAGRTAATWALASGAIAAAVLGRDATRRRDLGFALLAVVSVTTGAVTAIAAAQLPRALDGVAAASAFVVLEAAALVGERDAFWRRPLSGLAIAAEWFAAVAVVPATLLLVLLAPVAERGLDLFTDDPAARPELRFGGALVLVAVAWVVAGARRQRASRSPVSSLVTAAGDPRVALPFAAALVASVSIGTASTIATAVSLVAVTALLTASRRPVGLAVAAVAAVWAPVTAGVSHPAVAMLAGLAAAVVIAEAAIAEAADAGRRAGAFVLAPAAVGVALLATAVGPHALGAEALALVATVACWALAVDLDRGDIALGHVARAAILVPALVLAGSPAAGASVAVVATVLIAVDSVRVDEPLAALGAAVTGPLALYEMATRAGLTVGGRGLVLVAAAAVPAGMGALLPARWRVPLLAFAAASAAAGLDLASADRAMFPIALASAGLLVIGAGLVVRSSALAHLGGAVVVLGILDHLAIRGVRASDAYLAPVAVELVVAGWHLRRHEPRPSSWVAYGPAIAVLGGAALVERVTGGPAWHAVLAGAVAVAAVAVGGARRLAGPLLLGTVLVVAVTVVESFARLAGVPTWAWLALGGTALVGTGVALERAAGSPLDAGRRLVDVIADRFE